MAAPIPPVPLAGSCSVINDNTLYTYSASAFQSLPLQNGSDWSQLKSGVAVSGAACVKAPAPNATTALWIIGGATDDSEYPGLQYYSFTDKTWHTVEPVVKVTQNRRGHAAVYLPDSESILVYAGSQDDPGQYSIQTFALSVKKPFNVLSFAGKPVPVLRPLLLAWNSSAAITVGGKEGNKDVFLFNPALKGWTKYDTPLLQAPKSVDAQQGTLVQGKDGSKVLELYDMSVSPNTVSRVVLQDSLGRPARPGTTIGQDQSSAPSDGNSSLIRRDLSLADWPSYNDSAAPTYTRSGFSIAQPDQSAPGLVAISGGNIQHPVALFNQRQNTWIDSTKFFGLSDNNEQSFLGASSTSSTVSTSSPTTSSVATSSAAAVSDGNHSQTSVILGAVLGSILGFIVLLILALFCLRQRRKKKLAMTAEEQAEKPRLSFADRGAPYMMEAPGIPRGPADAHTSMAIMGGYTAGHTRASESRGSVSSTARLVPKRPYPPFNEAVEMGVIGEKLNDSHHLGVTAGNETARPATGSSGLLALPKRSSGWSRYFSGGADVMAPAGTRSPRKSGLSRKSLRSSRASSSYTQRSHQSVHDCNSHGPTQIPPLEMGGTFESSNVSEAIHSTPVNSPGHQPSDFGATRPSTMSSFLSSNPPSTLGDTIFTTPYETDEKNRWSPVPKGSDWTQRPGLRDTTTSSIYTSSEMAPRSPAMPTGFGATSSSASDRPVTRGNVTSQDTPSDSTSQPSISAFPFPQKSAALTKPSPTDALPKPGLSLMPPQRDSNVSNASSISVWPAPSAFAVAAHDRNPSQAATRVNPYGSHALSAPKQPEPTMQRTQNHTAQSTNPFLRKVDAQEAEANPTAFRNANHDTNRAANMGGLPTAPEVSKPVAPVPTSRDENVTLRPAPAQRASIVEIDDSDDDDFEEPVVVTASAGPAPTAVTAIPVPASTAMQYTVKKPQKPANGSDMSWVNLK